MSYIQGFVAAVPTANKEAYLVLAKEVWALFKEYGALSTVEAWGDDIADGTVTDFKRAVLAKPDETVVLSWIVWPDRETYRSAQARMMEDDRMPPKSMPFDGKRLIYGGFVPILETT